MTTKLVLPVSARDHVLGPANAAVTLVEYGDFECPHCGHAYPILARIVETLGKRLRFVFRNFPLSETHPHALHAAYAAEAAGLQDKFWEMHGVLMEHQDAQTDEDLVDYAQQLDLNFQKWLRDFKSEQVRSKVEQDFSSGVRSGVNGTPTFFINGVRYDGSFEYPDLLAALRKQTTAPVRAKVRAR